MKQNIVTLTLSLSLAISLYDNEEEYMYSSLFSMLKLYEMAREEDTPDASSSRSPV